MRDFILTLKYLVDNIIFFVDLEIFKHSHINSTTLTNSENAELILVFRDLDEMLIEHTDLEKLNQIQNV